MLVTPFPTAITAVVVESEPSDGAVQVFHNFAHVAHVCPTEHPVSLVLPDAYWAGMYCPEGLVKQQRSAKHIPQLELQSFHLRDQTRHPALPEHYVAVQPATTYFKHRVLQPEPLPYPVVLLGVGSERSLVQWPDAIDLRGQLTVAQAMAVVLHATQVLGVESWAGILGGCLGKPTTYVIDARADRELKPYWTAFWPTMEFRIQ